MDFPLIGFINIYQMLFLVQGLVLVYAVILYSTEQFFGTLISINYCCPNYPLMVFHHMIIFSTVLRIFLGKNCLSLIQSVEIVNMVSYSILYGKGILWNHHCLLGTYVRGLPLPTNYHPHERLYKHCLIFIFEIEIATN